MSDDEDPEAAAAREAEQRLDREEREKSEEILAEMKAIKERLEARLEEMRGYRAALREAAAGEPVTETPPALHAVPEPATEPVSDPSAVETSNNVMFVVMVAVLLLALLIMIVLVMRS